MVVELAPEQRLNIFTTGDQMDVRYSPLAGGGYVAIWQSDDQYGANQSIVAQRFDALGQRVGTPFQVDQFGGDWPQMGDVAGLADGSFVVTWRASSGTEIMARAFGADGIALGDEFRVDTEDYSTDTSPTVIGLASGGYAIAWSSYTSASNSFDILVQRYDSAHVPQGAAQPVGPTVGTQNEPAMASLSGGGYVVVWTDASGRDGDRDGIFAQRYTDAGIADGAAIAVNSVTASDQYDPDVTALTGGGFAVAWRDDNGDSNGSRIAVRVFDAAGNAAAVEITANVSELGNQSLPAIAATPDGGFFLAWYTDRVGTSYTYDIVGRHFSATGVPLGDEMVISQDGNAYGVDRPDLVALPNGLIAVGWDVPPALGDGDGRAVMQRLLMLTDAGLVLPVPPILEALDPQITFDEAAIRSAPALLDASGAVAISGPADFGGGRLIVSRLTDDEPETPFDGPRTIPGDMLGIRDQGSGADQIGVVGASVTYAGVEIGRIESDGLAGRDLIVRLNGSAVPGAVEALVENLTFGLNDHDGPHDRELVILLEDGDGGVSAPARVSIGITPAPQAIGPILAQDMRVNSFVPGTQDNAAIASLDDGGWVAMWESIGQDWSESSDRGIFGQRFDASGAPLGGEFQVNQNGLWTQEQVDLAAISGGALAGGWVAVWRDTSESDYLMGRLYGADGQPVGDQFALPASGSSNLSDPQVATSADGSFAVAWTGSNPGSANDIVLQRFNPDGSRLGAEIAINAFDASTQRQPDIAALAGGGYAVAWQSYRQGETDSYEISLRLVDAAGTPGAEIVVNQSTDGSQSDPQVTALSGGGAVVIWVDESGLDGLYSGVYGQIFDAAGGRVGGQFRVNETTAWSEDAPSVTALPGGGFAVAYEMRGSSGWDDVVIQYFAADGALLGRETAIAQDAEGWQQRPELTTLPGGEVVAVWSGTDPDGSYGLYQQVLGTAPGSAAPVLALAEDRIAFDEADVNGGPQLLLPGSCLADSDSADFAGGRLQVQMIGAASLAEYFGPADNGMQDQFGLRDQGTAPGQIGVTGNMVTYGGTVIGTITPAPGTDQPLSIEFNAAADVMAVSALISNLTYANGSDDPAAERDFRLVLTDGDGGVAVSGNVTIGITPDAERAVPNGGQSQVNSYENSTQRKPAVAALEGGGYVLAWESYDKDAGINDYGIAAQVFDGSGQPLGGEFLVNIGTAAGQVTPRLAPIAAADGGGFVAVWEDGGDAAAPIKARLFDADGTPRSGEIAVATLNGALGETPDVAMIPGGFAVTWRGINPADGTHDIHVQRFDGSGAKSGPEQVANAPGPDAPFEPVISGDGAGNIVVVWTVPGGADGDADGVFAQIFNAAGAGQGLFAVNARTDGDQRDAHVAHLSDGRFVVTWTTEEYIDGYSSAIMARVFAADGSPATDDFLVNDQGNGWQTQPQVTALAGGGFAIAFSDPSTREGTSSNVVVQEFNADGSRRDAAQVLAEIGTGSQANPVLAAITDGSSQGYAAAWDSSGSGGADDGSGYGIFTRVFGQPGTMTPVSAGPELDNLDDVTAFEIGALGTPQLIDAAQHLADSDSADFAGGMVELRHVDFRAEATDQLSVLDGRAITRSGAEIRYDGTLIGSIDATQDGQNGADLVIHLNAAANAFNTGILLERLAFESPGAATGERNLSLRVRDGDGGGSDARGIRLDLRSSVSAPGFALSDLDDRTVTEAELQAGILLDPAIDLFHPGGAAFDGGVLEVSFQTSIAWRNMPGADTLFVADQGTGPNQVGQVGNSIRFEGVEIGQVDATDDGQAGADLRINLGAAADADSIRAVIEAITYRHQGNDPAETQRFNIRVTDAANASRSGSVDIDITPDMGGDLRALGNTALVNAFTENQQQAPAMTELADGGFVVTWQSSGQDSVTDGSPGIYQQRFDADGTAMGPEQRVNQVVEGRQDAPAVAALPGGGWITVWTGVDSSQTASSRRSPHPMAPSAPRCA